VAKFRGDRPRELGDLAAKKKKHHEHFIRPPVTPYGRPKKYYTVDKALVGCHLREARGRRPPIMGHVTSSIT